MRRSNEWVFFCVIQSNMLEDSMAQVQCQFDDVCAVALHRWQVYYFTLTKRKYDIHAPSIQSLSLSLSRAFEPSLTERIIKW